jgi:hypothetical protein
MFFRKPPLVKCPNKITTTNYTMKYQKTKKTKKKNENARDSPYSVLLALSQSYVKHDEGHYNFIFS